MINLWRIAFVAFSLAAGHAAAAPADLLELIGSIPLPGVSGRIDHMNIDPAGGRLFVAALGNNTVEVVDLKANKRSRSLEGFGEPQGVFHIGALGKLFVANGSANRVDILDAETLTRVSSIDHLADADNLRYDAKAGIIYVGHGSGALRMIDAKSGKSLGDVRLSGHPEAFQLEEAGKRIFINVPDAGHIAVVDRNAGKVVATWKLQGAAANFPMALDEAGQRLYIGTRRPAALLVFNTATGEQIDKVSIGGDTDDLFFVPSSKRIYVVCGEGMVSVVARDEAGHHSLIGSLKTASHARTGLLDQASGRIFVASPAGIGAEAQLRVYRLP